MKSFLKKLLIYFSPLVALTILLELAVRSVPTSYSIKSEFLSAHGDKIEHLVLGSSHSYKGINPEWSTKPTFNAANSAQALYYDHAIYQAYVDEMQLLKTVIVGTSYPALWNFPGLSPMPNSREYARYFGLGQYESFFDRFDLAYYRFYRNLRVLYRYLIKHEVGTSPLGWRIAALQKRAGSIEASSARAIVRHHAYLGEQPFESQVPAENLALLEQWAADCQRRNIQLVFLLTPKHESYRALQNAEAHRYFQEAMMSLQQRYSSVVLLDLESDTGYTSRHFVDGDHLNTMGAKQLTRQVDALVSGLRRE